MAIKTNMSLVELSESYGFLPFFGFGMALAEYGTTAIGQSAPREVTQMYNRSFFRSQLGQAAIASIAAMGTFVLLSSQIAVTAPTPIMAAYEQVEIA
ncbi:hypothetical protein [Erythrobacter sp.]|uniref:hypothetical protein n=2 Tax=Sphingomonadales TaxID=204457 RepID=UPI001AFD35D2|nr:hypothetical protein [Erythrobacter sp.]MBO6528172.1 hypothetical protein [Erythrobacter sp.]MBO6530696.1 hypothetical protein [Erythrobacter sp.]